MKSQPYNQSINFSQMNYPSKSALPASLAPVITLSPVTKLHQQADSQKNNEQNTTYIEDMERHEIYSPVAKSCNKETQSYTRDSRWFESEKSSDYMTHSSTSISQDINFESIMNETLGSTPELPASMSSDALDIPFASLFDLTDFPASLEYLHTPKTVVKERVSYFANFSCPELFDQQGSCFKSPVKYYSCADFSSLSADLSVSNADSSVFKENSFVHSMDPSVPRKDTYISTADPSVHSVYTSVSSSDPSMPSADPSLLSEDPFVVSDLSIFIADPYMSCVDPSMPSDLFMVNDSSVSSADPFVVNKNPSVSITDPCISNVESYRSSVDPSVSNEYPMSSADYFVTSTDYPANQSIFKPPFSTCEYEKPEMVISCRKAKHHQPHLVFSEPLVVCALSESKPTKKKSTSIEFKVSNNYKHLAITDKHCSIDPQKTKTNSKFDALFVQSQSGEINTKLLSSASLSSILNETQTSCLADIFHETHINDQERHSKKASFIPCLSNHDIPPRDEHTSQKTMTSDSSEITENNLSVSNVSWSYQTHPDTMKNNTSNVSTCCREDEHKLSNDYFIPVQSRLPAGSSTILEDVRNRSASKRRNSNDIACSRQHTSRRAVRQQLSFKTPPKFKQSESNWTETSASANTSTCTREQTIRKQNKRRRCLKSLREQKENHSQSPSHDNKPQRRPLSKLSNMRLSKINTSTSFSNNPTVSPRNYAKSNDTFLGMILPCRKEELISRDAYYCDFTVDRQNKIDDFISRKADISNYCDEHDYQHTYQDPETSEIFVRKVEGAEDTSRIFQAPPLPHLRVPKTASHIQMQRLRSDIDTAEINKQLTCQLTALQRKKAGGSSHFRKLIFQNPSCSSEHAGSNFSASSNSYCPSGTRCSSESSRPSSQKSCTTHPIASSTMITDSSFRTIDGEEESCLNLASNEKSWSLEESYHCNKAADKKTQLKNHIKFHRPPISVGQDSCKHSLENVQDMKTFEISAMVSRIDCMLNNFKLTSGKKVDNIREVNASGNPRSRPDVVVSEYISTTNRNHTSTHILAGAKSIPKTVNKLSKKGTLQYSEIDSRKLSNVCNKRTSVSSMFFNHAKSSIVCTSSEESDTSKQDESSYEDASTVSKDDRYCQKYRECDGEEMCFVIPEQMNTEILCEYQQGIHEESTSSCGRLYPVGTVRLKHIRRSSDELHPTESSIRSGRDLLDSILTDSPRSVNTSGIFAPDNSYTIESVSSHNGNYKTSSVGTSSTLVKTSSEREPNYARIHPGRIIPHNIELTDKKNIDKIFVAPSRFKIESSNCSRKFKYTSEASSSDRDPSSRSYDTATSSVTSIVHRSCKNTAADKKSIFTVAPRVITGPPKIKSKNSLVHKLRKFSSNFYKKTEKIQILANL